MVGHLWLIFRGRLESIRSTDLGNYSLGPVKSVAEQNSTGGGEGNNILDQFDYFKLEINFY